ncbi:MAG: hypothetical protein J7498_16590, partial [Sphingobium sp.]|nr:hypothetical protein [Sphingobium sp.]
ADEGVQGAMREAARAGGLSEKQFHCRICSINVLTMLTDSPSSRRALARKVHRSRQRTESTMGSGNIRNIRGDCLT